MLRVAGHLDNLRAACAVSEHLALQNVVQIHFVGTVELRRAYTTKLASWISIFVGGGCSSLLVYQRVQLGGNQRWVKQICKIIVLASAISVSCRQIAHRGGNVDV